MAAPKNKVELLDEMQSGYRAFVALLARLDEPQLTTPGVNGDWSVKDILAHLATWQERAVLKLEAAKRGEVPLFMPSIHTDEEMDQFNAATFAAKRTLPLADIMQTFHASYARLRTAVEELDDEALFAGHKRFPWLEESELWESVAGNTFAHYEEHAPMIEAWLDRAAN
jgi:uncharacterized protein (TIGR03083 family)